MKKIYSVVLFCVCCAVLSAAPLSWMSSDRAALKRAVKDPGSEGNISSVITWPHCILFVESFTGMDSFKGDVCLSMEYDGKICCCWMRS